MTWIDNYSHITLAMGERAPTLPGIQRLVLQLSQLMLLFSGEEVDEDKPTSLSEVSKFPNWLVCASRPKDSQWGPTGVECTELGCMHWDVPTVMSSLIVEDRVGEKREEKKGWGGHELQSGPPCAIMLCGTPRNPRILNSDLNFWIILKVYLLRQEDRTYVI